MTGEQPQGLVWLTVAAIGCGDGGGPPDARIGCDSSDVWSTAPPMIRGPTQETAAVAIGGKVYAIGGFASSSRVVATVQVFDTAACSWSTGPDLPRPLHHANVAAIDGTIYVAGALVDTDFIELGDVWSWNPSSEAAWTARAPLPPGTARGSAVAGAIDGKLYVAGGLRTGAVTDVSIYDPVADSWQAGPALPAARDHACGGVIGGKLYVAGGRRATIGSITSTLFELAPGGAWIERAAAPTRRGGTACGVIGTRLIVAGGEGNTGTSSGVFPDVEAYDAATDSWHSLPPMPSPRHGMGAAAWNGKLYIPGGAIVQGFGTTEIHEVLAP